MEVWKGVHLSDLSPQERRDILHSNTMVQEKRLPSGELDRLKARHVADGSQQHKHLYEDLSSPNIASSSLFAIIAIAAAEERTVETLDIRCVFLNMPMEDLVKVHIRLDPETSQQLLKIDDSYRQFVDI